MVVSRLQGRAVRRAFHDSTESGALSFFTTHVESRAPLRGGRAVAGRLLVTQFFRRVPDSSRLRQVGKRCRQPSVLCSCGNFSTKPSPSNSLVARALTEKVHLAMSIPPCASRFPPNRLTLFYLSCC